MLATFILLLARVCSSATKIAAQAGRDESRERQFTYFCLGNSLRSCAPVPVSPREKQELCRVLPKAFSPVSLLPSALKAPRAAPAHAAASLPNAGWTVLTSSLARGPGALKTRHASDFCVTRSALLCTLAVGDIQLLVQIYSLLATASIRSRQRATRMNIQAGTCPAQAERPHPCAVTATSALSFSISFSISISISAASARMNAPMLSHLGAHASSSQLTLLS